jgi:hypothetical protein
MQDDYGNAFRHPDAQDFSALAERVGIVEERTKRIEDNTSDLIDAFRAAKGAFKTLEIIGKIARPLSWIGMLGGFAMYSWARIKGWAEHPFN